MATRDENLDALSKAASEWFSNEERRLNNEVKFLRAVLKGRGANNVGSTNLLEASKLVQTALSDFLRNS